MYIYIYIYIYIYNYIYIMKLIKCRNGYVLTLGRD